MAGGYPFQARNPISSLETPIYGSLLPREELSKMNHRAHISDLGNLPERLID